MFSPLSYSTCKGPNRALLSFSSSTNFRFVFILGFILLYSLPWSHDRIGVLSFGIIVFFLTYLWSHLSKATTWIRLKHMWILWPKSCPPYKWVSLHDTPTWRMLSTTYPSKWRPYSPLEAHRLLWYIPYLFFCQPTIALTSSWIHPPLTSRWLVLLWSWMPLRPTFKLLMFASK